MMDLRKVGEGSWRHLSLMTALLLFFLAGECARARGRSLCCAGERTGRGVSGRVVGVGRVGLGRVRSSRVGSGRIRSGRVGLIVYDNHSDNNSKILPVRY